MRLNTSLMQGSRRSLLLKTAARRAGHSVGCCLCLFDQALCDLLFGLFRFLPRLFLFTILLIIIGLDAEDHPGQRVVERRRHAAGGAVAGDRSVQQQDLGLTMVD